MVNCNTNCANTHGYDFALFCLEFWSFDSCRQRPPNNQLFKFSSDCELFKWSLFRFTAKLYVFFNFVSYIRGKFSFLKGNYVWLIFMHETLYWVNFDLRLLMFHWRMLWIWLERKALVSGDGRVILKSFDRGAEITG